MKIIHVLKYKVVIGYIKHKIFGMKLNKNNYLYAKDIMNIWMSELKCMRNIGFY